jgi:uncharacterized BrkB/YihY/UPF0761 family membrane protein
VQQFSKGNCSCQKLTNICSLRKELWLFMVALALVVCFTITLLLWLIWGIPSVEDKKWIFALLGSAFGVASTVLLKK